MNKEDILAQAGILDKEANRLVAKYNRYKDNREDIMNTAKLLKECARRLKMVAQVEVGTVCTVHILADVDNTSELADFIASLMDNEAVIDWAYDYDIGYGYAYGEVVEIPEDYQEGDIRKLLTMKRYWRDE